MSAIGVIGLGLVGGSIARDLHAIGHTVIAYDHEESVVAAACEEGVVQPLRSIEHLSDLDSVIVATPVSAIAPTLEQIEPHSGLAGVVMDVGSTKRSVLAAAERLGLRNFVGAHPLAGDHRDGWEASRRGMFLGARVTLCAARTSGAGCRWTAERLWRELGAEPEWEEPEAHDRRAALVSHLPQLAASGLARVLDREGVTPLELGTGGRDATRLAGSEPRMWTDIVLDNADQLEPAVQNLVEELSSLQAALRARDRQAIREFFAASRAWRDARASES